MNTRGRDERHFFFNETVFSEVCSERSCLPSPSVSLLPGRLLRAPPPPWSGWDFQRVTQAGRVGRSCCACRGRVSSRVYHVGDRAGRVDGGPVMNAQVWGLSPEVVTRTCPLRLWGRLRGYPATIRGAVTEGVTCAHRATRHCPEPGV